MICEALADVLLKSVEEKQAETLIERLVNVKAKVLVKALIDTLAEEKTKTLNQPQFKVNSRGYILRDVKFKD